MIEKMLTTRIKNQPQPIHWHESMELNFVLRGEMEVVRNNRTFNVTEGEIIVLNREDVHSINRVSDDILYVQLHFEMEQFNQYIPEIWTVIFYCSPENNDAVCRNLKSEIKSHVANIVQLMSERTVNIDAEKRINYCSIDILSSLKLGFAAIKEGEGNKMNEEQKGRLWKVIDYLYDNHSRKLSLHEVAQQVYVSDDYVSKILKKGTGRGFEEFIGFVRSEMSIRDLLNTDKKITDISYDVGFSALKYYNAAFEKHYGCSPLEYRKQNKEHFSLEKHQESSGVIADEGVMIADALILLEKYRLKEMERSVASKIDVDMRNLKKSGEALQDIRYPKNGKHEIINYNIQREMSDIKFPCFSPNENVFIWNERNACKILIMNIGSMNKCEYRIKICGLAVDEKYVYCRAKTPDVPPAIMKLTATENIGILNRDIIDNMYNMTYEYGEVTGEEQIYMNIELSGDQIAKLIFQKI